MGHYYHGSITLDPETTRDEMLAAAEAHAATEPEYRRGTVKEWIDYTPDRPYTNLPWCIAWWGNFRGVEAHEFCGILAKNNMGRTRTLVMVEADEEPGGDRPLVTSFDYSTWVEYDWVQFEERNVPHCATENWT